MSKEPTHEVLYPKRSVVVLAYSLGWKMPPALVTITHPDGRQQRYAVQASLPNGPYAYVLGRSIGEEGLSG
jgi:hypothetical protein